MTVELELWNFGAWFYSGLDCIRVDVVVLRNESFTESWVDAGSRHVAVELSLALLLLTEDCDSHCYFVNDRKLDTHVRINQGCFGIIKSEAEFDWLVSNGLSSLG